MVPLSSAPPGAGPDMQQLIADIRGRAASSASLCSRYPMIRKASNGSLRLWAGAPVSGSAAPGRVGEACSDDRPFLLAQSPRNGGCDWSPSKKMPC